MGKRVEFLFSKDKINTYINLLASILIFVMAFIINLILTNYSSVDDFGKYKFATNFLLTIPAIFGLGVNWSCGSLIAKKDLSENKNLIGAGIVLTLILSLVATVLLYGAIFILNNYGILNNFSNSKFILLFAVIFMLQVLVNQVYQGTGEIVKLSIFNLLPNVFIIVGLWINIFFYGEVDYSYAIYLYVISYAVSIIPRIFGTPIKFNNLKSSMTELWGDIRINGIKVYFSSIFTASAAQIIGLIGGSLYGFKEYGYYSLALSMSFAFKLIASATATAKFRDNAFKKEIPKSDFIFMIILDVVIYMVFLVLIDKIFFIFFPEDYAVTVMYLKILAIMNMLHGFSQYINRFFILKSAGSLIMKNSIITAVVNVIISVIMIKYMQMTGLVIANVLTAIANVSLYLYQYNKYIKKVDEYDL